METQTEKKYQLWVNKHSRTLRKYAGQWVGLKLGKGVVSSGKSLKQVHKNFLKAYPNEKPHLLRVPPQGKHFYILFLS